MTRHRHGWISTCPLTGKSRETDTLAQGIVWFAGQTLAWAARRWLVPLGIGIVLLGLVARKGSAP
jgi:hypothetical protein